MIREALSYTGRKHIAAGVGIVQSRSWGWVAPGLSSLRHHIVKKNLHGLGCPLNKGPMIFRAVGLEGRDFRSAAGRGGALSFPKGHTKCLA